MIPFIFTIEYARNLELYIISMTNIHLLFVLHGLKSLTNKKTKKQKCFQLLTSIEGSKLHHSTLVSLNLCSQHWHS